MSKFNKYLKKPMKLKELWGSGLIIIGGALSPIVPWNDALINLPLAYLFALPFSLIHEGLFIPMAAIGYLLTNILGFVLMGMGYSQLRGKKYSFAKNWKRDLLVSFLYTLLLAVLMLLGILPSLETITSFFKK